MAFHKWTKCAFIWAIIILITSGCSLKNKNLLDNPSFEETGDDGPAAWKTMAFNFEVSELKLEEAGGLSGQRFVTIINHKPGDTRYRQLVPVNEFKKYRLSVWTKTENVGPKEKGANISIDGHVATSQDVKGTNGQWEYLELYLKVGKGVYSVPVTLGLGGFGSINTGKASFDDARMEEVETIPDDAVVESIGTINNSGETAKPSLLSPSTFNNSLMIWLFIVLLIIFVLIWQDIVGKQDLYHFGKHYLLLALFLVMFWGIYAADFGLSTKTIQLSFTILLVFAIASALALWKMGKWKGDTLAAILIILGIAVRICYFFYTNCDERQHDVLGEQGHMGYITYIARHWWLPPLGDCQMYHPPIHHSIGAILLFLGNLLGINEHLTWRLVQMGMVFLSSLALIFFYKSLKQLDCGNITKIVGVATFAFHPTNIYLAAFLNNDNTLLFFFVMSIYALIRWSKEHSLKNVLWLAIFVSFVILTKKSAFILLPIIFIAVLIAWFRDRPDIKPFLKQAVVFGLIVIPAAVIYPLRNYYLFQQDLNYTLQVSFEPLSNKLSALFGMSVHGLLQNPFTIDPFMDWGKHAEAYLEYLIKSSLFGEWEFPGLKIIAVVLIILAVVNLVNLILLLVQYYRTRKREIKNYDYIFWLNIVFLIVLGLTARLKSPFVCTQNFRYIAPILISISYFWGQTIQWLADLNRGRWWIYVSISLAAAFCIASTIFILMIGV